MITEHRCQYLRFKGILMKARRLGILAALLLIAACQHSRDIPTLSNIPGTEQPQQAMFPDEPLLRLNPGMHTAKIKVADIDRGERFLVSASHDKSVKIWGLQTGRLLKTLRIPAGAGNIGKAYAVAMSPDSETIAVGGYTGKYHNHFIYLFDRKSGRIQQRISGLEQVILHLSYSHDGRYLAASLGGRNGLRIYRTSDYREVFADRDYDDSSYWATFDQSGRLAATSDDGQVRLYRSIAGRWRKRHHFATGKSPYAAAFSPNGKHLAIGFLNNPEILILDANSLKPVTGPDTVGIDNGDVFSVNWSKDGKWLWAGGTYDGKGDDNHLLGWPQIGGNRVSFPVTTDTIMQIIPMNNGDNLVVSGDGLSRLTTKGRIRWQQTRPLADFRNQRGKQSIRVSADGSRVQFGFEQWGTRPGWLDLRRQTLIATAPGHAKNNPVIAPDWSAGLQGAQTQHPGLSVTDWESHDSPKLNGRPLPLKQWERSRSLAIAPDGQSFVLGTEWSVRRFGAQGQQIWRISAPGVAWSVAISADGRWLIAGLGDGTLRWYDHASGEERLAFFPHENGVDWVSWTPEGFFAGSSPAANHLFGYQLNNGADRAPDFIAAEQLYETFYRPDLVLAKFEGNTQLIDQALAQIGDIREVLKSRPPKLELAAELPHQIDGTRLTLPLKIIDQGGGIGEIEVKVNGFLQKTRAEVLSSSTGQRGEKTINISLEIPPDRNSEIQVKVKSASNGKGVVLSQPLFARVYSTAKPGKQPALVGLAVGIDRYRDPDLRLKYAVNDVNGLLAAFENTAAPLFTRIDIQPVTDLLATKQGIIAAFEAAIANTRKEDVFLLYLSGHGTVVDGKYYFLPRDLIYSNRKALVENSLTQDELAGLLSRVPAEKSLIVLDTCYAAGFKPQLQLAFATRGIAERTAIDRLTQMTGRAVFYASSDKKVALEGYNNHGLFTGVLLEGLQSQADYNGDNRINVAELETWLIDRVPAVSLKKFGVESFPMVDKQGHSFPIAIVPQR